MAQDTTPAMVIYTGVYDSETQTYQTSFQAPFDKGSYGEIKVAFVRRGLTDYTYDPDTYTTEVIDDRVWIHWTGDDITTNDIICIVRETQDGQPYTYPNNQKHIERALDNLSRQIQEVAKKAQNALLVDPSWMPVAEGGSNDPDKMDPVTWLQTIVRSKGKTLRELRIDNGYIAYTTDDPDGESKTWEVIAGVKTGNAGVVSHIRETKVLAEDGVTYVPFLEYSVDGGETWNPAGRNASELEHLYVKKVGDTMSGELDIANTTATSSVPLLTLMNGTDESKVWQFAPSMASSMLYLFPGTSNLAGLAFSSNGLQPCTDLARYLGTNVYRWLGVFTATMNGIVVPSGTTDDAFALESQVNLAANSGSQLYRTGVWYAKMEAATTVPSYAEVEGRNYADFSEVDANNNPVIKVYEYTSGAWVLLETITPPATYNGYITVTSKIWDIQEQAGQQGGQVLWSYSAKTFTPYPKIVSFESISVTGTSTVAVPANPGATQIVNKDYVDSAITSEFAAHPTIQNVVVTSTTGVVTITLSAESSSVAVKKLIGGTAVAGTLTSVGPVYTFTPTTADDILNDDWIITI